MATPQKRAIGPRPYKDFLTPALHRRFTRAAGLTLLICYVEAFLIGEKTSLFWSWFPIGTAGVKTLLLAISPLSIYLLRVAQLHVGAHTSASPFDGFLRHVLRLRTLSVFAHYAFSAFWFSEVYLWSMSTDANMGWVVEGKAYERPRLNERPIYLRNVFYMQAAIQSFLHLALDYDGVTLPSSRETAAQGPSSTNPLNLIKQKLPGRARAALTRSLALLIVGPIIHALFLRRTSWAFMLSFAKIFWSLPRSSSAPPTVPPYHISLLYRSLAAGFLLSFLWESTNLIFSAYLVQEPLKQGKPLTDDSKDPNGSLLTGLKSPRDIPKTFALWELSVISRSIPQRRKTIFEEIDRLGGSTWKQVLASCNAVLEDISARVTSPIQPAITPPTAGANGSAPPPQPPAPQLPRIAAPLNTSPIGTPAKPSTPFSNFAKARGSSSSPHSPSPLRKVTSSSPSPLRNLIAPSSSTSTTSTNPIEGVLSSASATLPPWLFHLLRYPFRKTTRRVAALQLLEPRTVPSADGVSPPRTLSTNLSMMVYAVEAVTHLAIASLVEDTFGAVQGDIAPLIVLMTSTAEQVQMWKTQLVSNRPIPKEGEEGGGCVEVDSLLSALTTHGLARVIGEFGKYADDLRLGLSDLRRARGVIERVETTLAKEAEERRVKHTGAAGGHQSRTQGLEDPFAPRERREGRERRERREMEKVR